MVFLWCFLDFVIRTSITVFEHIWWQNVCLCFCKLWILSPNVSVGTHTQTCRHRRRRRVAVEPVKPFPFFLFVLFSHVTHKHTFGPLGWSGCRQWLTRWHLLHPRRPRVTEAHTRLRKISAPDVKASNESTPEDGYRLAGFSQIWCWHVHRFFYWFHELNWALLLFPPHACTFIDTMWLCLIQTHKTTSRKHWNHVRLVGALCKRLASQFSLCIHNTHTHGCSSN